MKSGITRVASSKEKRWSHLFSVATSTTHASMQTQDKNLHIFWNMENVAEVLSSSGSIEGSGFVDLKIFILTLQLMMTCIFQMLRNEVITWTESRSHQR